MSKEVGDAFDKLSEFFEVHRQNYNLNFGLQYSSIIDWVADITPRRGHPKARQYPLWQASGGNPSQAIRRAIDLARSAIADHQDGEGQLD